MEIGRYITGMKQNLGVPVILIKDNQVLLAKRKNAYGEGLNGLPEPILKGHKLGLELLVEDGAKWLVEG